jgi:hypothetical protein
VSECVCHNLVPCELHTEGKETVEKLAYNKTYRVFIFVRYELRLKNQLCIKHVI